MRYRTLARLILALATLMSLSGCIVTYPAIARFQDFNEVLYGEVKADLLVGGSDFTLEGKVTGIRCQGSSNVTYIPSSLSCRGQRGEIFATCSDGRSVTGEWFGQSCKTGYGRGIDNSGNAFVFNFGMSTSEAESQLYSAMAAASQKPDLPTYKPKETRKEKGYSTGTGFFVSTSGHLITNFHVIDGASEISIRTSKGTELLAAVVARDPANDVALLKVD